MTRILVDPDQLRALGNRLQRTSGDLRGVEGRVGRALGSLNWEARQKANVEGQANQARSQARRLAAQAEEMARYLQRKAQAFEEADGQGSRTFGDIRSMLDRVRQMLYNPTVAFPTSEVGAHMRAGGNDTDVSPTPVPQWPDDRQVIFDFALDKVLEKLEPLNIAKDAWDLMHVQEWQDKWDRAMEKWWVMRQQYGPNSPQAQEAYGEYLKTAVFEMPVFGSKLKFIYWLSVKTANLIAKPVH